MNMWTKLIGIFIYNYEDCVEYMRMCMYMYVPIFCVGCLSKTQLSGVSSQILAN